MDWTTASLIGLGIIALVIVGFFVVFRGKGKFSLKTRFGEATAEGENPVPPSAIPSGVKIKEAEAGRDVRASSSQGGLDMEKIKAKRDIEVSHSTTDPAPKE
jgi:hypothetical protein